MRRREFVGLLGGAAAWPLATQAQQTAPVVGFLRNSPAAGSDHLVAGLRKGLREAGFVEGQNLTIEFAWTEGDKSRLPDLANRLVQNGVSVIVASTIVVVTAAKNATSTIPIVFAIANDPVEAQIVTSMAQPGGNATGVSYLTSELGGKRLGILHELLPTLTRAHVLANPVNPATEVFVQDAKTAANVVGISIDVLTASSEREIEEAFNLLSNKQAGGLLVANDPFFTTRREQITALALRQRIPSIFVSREFAEAGGLISYGTNLPDVYRHAGLYAARILQGAKPSELPVILPTTFELVINLRTAKAIGITVPEVLTARADEVIE